MKTNKQIILSTAATLALLLSGCNNTGSGTAAEAQNAGQTIAGNLNAPADENTDTSNGGGTSNGGNNGGEDIPNPGDGGGDIPVEHTNVGGWYARTIVSATAPDGKVYSHSTAGVFGTLIDSEDSLDKHDIPSYGPSTLQVIFPQADKEGADSNGYFSEYQSFSKEDTGKRTWEFQIKNQDYPDLSSAPIHISLKGVYDLTYKKTDGKISYEESTKENSTKAQELTLLDVDNANYYTLEDLKTANLSMDGKHTRTFKWVLGTVEQSDYTAAAATEDDEATIKAFAVSNKANDISARSVKSGGKFGLPPQ